jgi:hypothetical protein
MDAVPCRAHRPLAVPHHHKRKKSGVRRAVRDPVASMRAKWSRAYATWLASATGYSSTARARAPVFFPFSSNG